MTGPPVICDTCRGDGVCGDWPHDCPTCDGRGVLDGTEETIAIFVEKLDAWGTSPTSKA